MSTSQNGFPVSASRADIGVKTFRVPDYPAVQLPVRADIAPLLLEMARWFFATVQPPEVPGCWGYAYRPIAGQTSGYSNHASGTAIDLNAPAHPLGKVGTMPAGKAPAIIAKAHSLGLRWGGEYSGRRDEMHFEVNVSLATALGLVAKLQAPPPGGGGTSGRPTIRQGATGQPVRDLQARLDRDYPAYSKLTVDGQFGPATDKVVREFQRRAGLGVDGIVGPKTWAALHL